MTRKITSAGPSITEAEIALVSEAIREGWQEKMSFYINQFREEFSAYVGLPYCLPTAHCTDAIHLALLALGIGEGDEVIVPDLTWVASAAPITYTGAKPVFADIDPNSWCITPEAIERCITHKTKAVVVVDLLGNIPDMDPIVDLCKQRGIYIIEDAAEGIGAKYKGKQAGQFGDVSLFSFNATKLIMSGQGGMLATRNEEIFKRAKLYSHHGIDKELTGKYFWSSTIGYNYNWTNIQAALALSQLRRIDELLDYKKWLYKSYKKHIHSLDGVILTPTKPEVDHSFWISCILLDESFGLNKEEWIEKFADHQIDMRPMFYPLSMMPPFQQYTTGQDMDKQNPNAYRVSARGLCLPNGNNLDEEDVAYICETLRKILTL